MTLAWGKVRLQKHTHTHSYEITPSTFSAHTHSHTHTGVCCKVYVVASSRQRTSLLCLFDKVTSISFKERRADLMWVCWWVRRSRRPWRRAGILDDAPLYKRRNETCWLKRLKVLDYTLIWSCDIKTQVFLHVPSNCKTKHRNLFQLNNPVK